MKKRIIMLALSAACFIALTQSAAGAREFDKVPLSWKWLGNEEVLFTYDGTFAQPHCSAEMARQHLDQLAKNSCYLHAFTV